MLLWGVPWKGTAPWMFQELRSSAEAPALVAVHLHRKWCAAPGAAAALAATEARRGLGAGAFSYVKQRMNA